MTGGGRSRELIETRAISASSWAARVPAPRRSLARAAPLGAARPEVLASERLEDRERLQAGDGETRCGAPALAGHRKPEDAQQNGATADQEYDDRHLEPPSVADPPATRIGVPRGPNLVAALCQCARHGRRGNRDERPESAGGPGTGRLACPRRGAAHGRVTDCGARHRGGRAARMSARRHARRRRTSAASTLPTNWRDPHPATSAREASSASRGTRTVCWTSASGP